MNRCVFIKGFGEKNSFLASTLSKYGIIEKIYDYNGGVIVQFDRESDAVSSMELNKSIVNGRLINMEIRSIGTRNTSFLFLELKQWFFVLCVMIISLCTHLPRIEYPKSVVFDETHFGNFISDYIKGVSFFDIHPPLAKLILAGYAKVIGYDGKYNFSTPDSKYSSDFYINLRRFPAIFSSLVSPLITASLYLRGNSNAFSIMGGLLFAFDFTSITQSRFILTDGILYFFVALTIYVSSMLKHKENWTIILLQALAGSCAFCCKFTAGGTLVFIAFTHITLLRGRKDWFLILFIRGSVIFFVLLSVIWTTMYIHIKMLPRIGYGDKYMRPDFREMSIYNQIPELLYQMYRYNRDLTATHPYSSKWYQWPFSISIPLLIWMKWPNQFIFIFNNPVCSIASLIGAIASLFYLQFDLLFGYLASYVPFFFVTRCMWSYHYQIPLIFGIMAFSHVSDTFFHKRKGLWSSIVLLLCIASYLFWFSWIYGTSMPYDNHKTRVIWPELKKMLNIK